MIVSPLRFFTDSLVCESPMQDMKLNSPELVLEYWKDHIASDPTLEMRKEHLVVVPLNPRMEPTGHTIVSTGTADQALANLVEVFRPVILAGVYHLLVIHNHPTGNTTPSPADKRITGRIKSASELLDIRLVDHVIIGTSPGRAASCYSFREEGLL